MANNSGDCTMPSWNTLCSEVQQMIFEALANAGRRSSYACVNSAWRTFFEPQIFAELQITSADLPNFDAYVRGPRRVWLQRLQFRFQILPHPPHLHEWELPNQETRNNIQLTIGLLALFNILHKWKGLSIELELSTCPADLPDDPEFDPPTLTLEFPENGPCELPLVAIVSTLSITRRNCRIWSPWTLSTILARLPELEQLHYEPWRSENRGCEEQFEKELARSVLSWPPSHSVNLFYHINPAGHSTWDEADRDVYFSKYGWREERLAYRFHGELGRALATFSQRVENFSVVHMTDARHFFGDFFAASSFPTSWDWPRLQSLALTSRLLRQDEEFGPLLLAASRAAKRMPALQIMALFHAGEEAAALFCYRTDRTPTARWESTWVCDIDEDVRKEWSRERPELVFSVDLIDDEYHGPARFIQERVPASGKVLHPQSLASMLADETENTG